MELDSIINISVDKTKLNGYRPMSNTESFKGIVIGKITSSQMCNLPINEYVVKESSNDLVHATRFNYFIDSDDFATVYMCLPDGVAGNVCKFDVYSRKASQNFPILCPPTDAKYSPREYSPDEVLISIMVKVDGTTMTIKQNERLRQLVRQLWPSENNNISVMNNVFSLDSFPQMKFDKDKVGHLFSDLIQFMLFKKSI